MFKLRTHMAWSTLRLPVRAPDGNWHLQNKKEKKKITRSGKIPNLDFLFSGVAEAMKIWLGHKRKGKKKFSGCQFIRKKNPQNENNKKVQELPPDDRNHYFGLGPIPKPKPKLADTFGQYCNNTETRFQGENLVFWLRSWAVLETAFFFF